MKKIIALVLLFITILASAQEHLKFKNVPIDGSLNSFVQKLNDEGLALDLEKYSNQIAVLHGDFAGLSNCTFHILTTKSGTVCKVMVTSDNYYSWRTVKSEYNKYKELYLGKYTYEAEYEFFSRPYYEGDGYELSAIALDKAHFVTFFKAEGGGITVRIGAINSSKGFIRFIYEDDKNMNRYSDEKTKTISEDI
jgi:hypothetical protein